MRRAYCVWPIVTLNTWRVLEEDRYAQPGKCSLRRMEMDRHFFSAGA